jgi:hypothetical protein
MERNFSEISRRRKGYKSLELIISFIEPRAINKIKKNTWKYNSSFLRYIRIIKSPLSLEWKLFETEEWINSQIDIEKGRDIYNNDTHVGSHRFMTFPKSGEINRILLN